MKYFFTLHVVWREDNNFIIISDPKRAIDLKLEKKYLATMKRIENGIDAKDVSANDFKVLWDFLRLGIVAPLVIEPLSCRNFEDGISIIEKELGFNVRGEKELKKMMDNNRKYFIGAFLANEVIGVITGFPREEYIVLSELAIEPKYHKKGIGKMLVEAFEAETNTVIRAGAVEKAIGFYEKLGWHPSLLVQFKGKNFNTKDKKIIKLKKQKQVKQSGQIGIYYQVKKPSLRTLRYFQKKYPMAYFQYIFSNRLEFNK